MKKTLFLAVCLLMTTNIFAQYHQDRTIELWDNSTAPHSNALADGETENYPYHIGNVTSAALYVYDADPDKSTGEAVVICPGGGYGYVSMDNEGFLPAQWLAENGITAYVLKYRMPAGHKEVPLEDALKAMRTARADMQAKDSQQHRVGIMGFSAGGHLAATASNMGGEDTPDFAILFYPVISSEPAMTHSGSFDNLLGSKRSRKQSRRYSMDRCTGEHTPPTLLILSDDDVVVPSAGAALYYASLKRHGIRAAMAIYPSGGHGFGNFDRCPYQSEWHNLLLRWLKELRQ